MSDLAPLMLTAKQARCGIADTDWPGVGVGAGTFRRWVKAGIIPSRVDPDTDYRWYSKLELVAWAATAHERGTP